MNMVPSVLPLAQPVGVAETKQNTSAAQGQVSFGELLNKAINDVNSLQKQADAANVQLVTGQVEDIHSVMIAAEKATIALQFTMQVRNKVIDAYQEVMRMNV